MELQTSDMERIDQVRYYTHGYPGYSIPLDMEEKVKGKIVNRPGFIESFNKENDREVMTKFSHHWFNLYNVLTYQEANVFYNYLRPVDYIKSQQIIGYSGPSDKLFFLNKGTLGSYTKQNERVRCTQTFKPGTVIGAVSFFSNQNTDNMILALEDVELDSLDTADMEHIDIHFPELAMKLKEYCLYQENGSVYSTRYINEPGQLPEAEVRKQTNDSTISTNQYIDNFSDRRMHKRIKTSGVVVGRFYDHSDTAFEYPVQGTLNDISKGGFSFEIEPIPGVDLIGKELDVVLNVNINTKKCNIDWGGKVVGVQMDEQKLSVNIAGNILH